MLSKNDPSLFLSPTGLHDDDGCDDDEREESKKQGRMKNTKVAIEVLYVGNERREEQ